MGLFGSGEKPKERADLGVCIPEHRQKAAEQRAEQAQQAQEITPARGKARFLITGVYAMRGDLSIAGEVVSGNVKKGARLSGMKKTSVRAIQSGPKSVSMLKSGERGMLFLNKSGSANLRSGETIEFS